MISRTRVLTICGTAVATAAAATVTLGATTGVSADSHARHTAVAQAKSPQAAPHGKVQSRLIASSTLGRDYRSPLPAVRSRPDPLAASVTLRVYTFRSGKWRQSDKAAVGRGNGWFWYPLTGRHSVCQFSTASTKSASVTVRLLVTPSVGCSQPYRFRVKNGHLTRR